MKQVVISGYYGFDNIGDDAMIETFANFFKSKGINLIVMSNNPEKTSKEYNVEAVNRFKILKIIKAIKKSDILISGGGTLLQDVTKVRSIWYYLFIIFLAIFFKKPVYLLFQGIGPINNRFNIFLTRKILSKVKTIVLRDKKAYLEMQKLKFDVTNVKVATDLVFNLEIPNKQESINIIKKYIPDYSENKKYIGVSLRPWKNIDNKKKFASILDSIKEKYNVQIVFIPFHKKQDYQFSKDIQSLMKEESYIIENTLSVNSEYELKPSQLAGIMSLMSLNIGVRLHSLVFAVITKVPLIGISYDPKIDGFLNEIGMRAICRYDNIDEKIIINQIEKLLKGETDKFVYNKIDEKKEIINKVLNDVIDAEMTKKYNDKVEVLGINFDNVTMKEAIEKCEKFINNDKLNFIVTPNPEFVMKAKDDEEFKKIVNKADLIIPDGIGIIKAGKILKNELKERVAGYDLVCNIFNEKSIEDKRVYILGAKPMVAQKAKENIEKKYNVKVVGFHDGYFELKDEEDIVDEIAKSGANILLVGMGMKRQEKFIFDNKEKLKVKIAIGCGGTIDVLAGQTKRAPKFWINHNLEWLYRLLKEPSRIGRMMVLPKFLIIVFLKKFNK